MKPHLCSKGHIRAYLNQATPVPSHTSPHVTPPRKVQASSQIPSQLMCEASEESRPGPCSIMVTSWPGSGEVGPRQHDG